MIKIKLERGATVPEYATLGSAAVDLVAMNDAPISIHPGADPVAIPTGISLDMTSAENVCALILPRSGLGVKGLVLGNTVGLIDNDYQGEIKVMAWNRNSAVKPMHMGTSVNMTPIVIEPGMRLAQLMFMTFAPVEFDVVDNFDQETDRGDGAFGSTGVIKKRKA